MGLWNGCAGLKSLAFRSNDRVGTAISVGSWQFWISCFAISQIEEYRCCANL
jgi:hypothetical protein